MFLLVVALMMVWKGVGRGFRYATAFLLAEYTALLLYFTVFLHRSEGVRQMVLTPFLELSCHPPGNKNTHSGICDEHRGIHTHWHDVGHHHAGSGMVEGYTCRYGHFDEHRTVATDSDARLL